MCVLSVVVATLSWHPATAQTTNADCAPRDGMTFVCGLENAEDLFPIGDTGWIVASSFHGGPGNVPGFGPLSLINEKTHAVMRLYPRDDAPADQDKARFKDCDAPPAMISSHGLDVRETKGGYRLLAVNHGGRESIEVFFIDFASGAPHIKWRGCILIPKEVRGNAVTSLPDGRIVVSGENVAIWSLQDGWKNYTPGLIKRANGIVASPDGKWLYIDGSDDYTVNLVATDGRIEDRKVLITSPLAHADNIRRGSDGHLYVAGTVVAPEDSQACFRSKLCNAPTEVIDVDPATNTARELMRIPASVGAFGAGTTALRVGNELWIGASKGDRVAIVPMPK
jgi:hypothetical protein